MKFAVENVKIKTVNKNVILLDLKIINYTTSVRNVIKRLKPVKGLKISDLVSILQG